MEKTDLIAPITSLQFTKELLLSGEGPYLCVYNVTDGIRLNCWHVLGNARIHGIRANHRKETLSIVFGQKSLRIVNLTSLENQIRIDDVTEIITIPDLILDAHWLHENNGNTSKVAIATAHNAVWCVDYLTSKEYLVAQCEENSILYSARFFGETLSNLLLAAGTVFNQVLLWNVKESEPQSSKAKILHRLTGHEGVIFQLSFNDTGTLMVSVSDDRSIRLWRLVLTECGIPQEATELLVLYGHSARVWDAKLLSECIVSIGEDAVCNVWDYTGELVKTFAGHLGKSIWSLAANKDNNMIATGGGDGSIRLFSLNDLRNQESMTTITTYLPGTEQGMVAKKNVTIDTPRSVCLGSDGKLFVMTSEGCLYEYFWRKSIHQQEVKQEEAWKLLLKDSNYSSYSLMSMSPDRQLIAFGNLAGNIKIFLTKDISSKSEQLKPFTSKVLSLIWASAMESYNLFSCGPNGIIIWWQITINEENEIQSKKIQTFCIPYSKQRWASAVEVVTSSVDLHGDCHVIFGDRKGSIHLFNCQGAMENDVLNPIQTLYGLHGVIGVTQLCCHGRKLYSTGRDGTYKQYKLSCDKLELIDTKKVFKGLEWVEKLLFTANGDLVIAGFHTAYFVVWSASKNEELFKVKCGGGHRAWDFTLHQQLEPQSVESVFTYLKGNSINTHRVHIKNHIANPILKPSFHGRETTCVVNVCDLPFGKQETKRHHLFVTGSEDTTLNLMSYDYTTGRSIKLFTAQGHISSVRALSVTTSTSKTSLYDEATHDVLDVENEEHSRMEYASSRRCLLFSGGGRASLRCWRIDPTVVDRNGMISSAPVSFVSEYSSRSSSHKRRRKRKEGHLHSEIRFMSLSSFPLSVVMGDGDILADVSLGLYGVAAACSDGFVRIFIFDEKESKFFLLAQTQYLLRCALSVQHVVYKDSTERCTVLVIAGDTAGKISIWDITEQLIQYIREEADDFDITQDNFPKSTSPSTTIKDIAMTTNEPVSVAMATDVKSRDVDDLDYDKTKDNKKYSTTDYHTNERYSTTKDITSEESKFSCINLLESSLGQPLHVFKAHQSGVNDISIFQACSSFVLSSGGDDSALFLAEFQVCSTNTEARAVHVIRQEIIQSAHTSSVTGVKLLDESTLISSSTDQRLKKWKISKKTIELDHVTFVDVPDVQAIESWRTGINDCCVVAVCGIGLQTIKQQS